MARQEAHEGSHVLAVAVHACASASRRSLRQPHEPAVDDGGEIGAWHGAARAILRLTLTRAMMLSAQLLSTSGLTAIRMPGSIVPVLVPVPLDGPFDYRLAEGPAPAAGTFVEVPFAGRAADRRGLGRSRPARSLRRARLKPLGAVLDAPPMPARDAGA